MRIGVTGCNGSVGKRVTALALKRGHSVVGIDFTDRPPISNEDAQFSYVQVDLRGYEDTLKALKECDAVVHLAAVRNPGDYVVYTHNTNVVISWNVMRAVAELGINRIAQASSVNVLTMVFSQTQHFDYFPIDEDHPCRPDEPYGLSKVICETQASALVRRYPSMRIASLRLHWSLPEPSLARQLSEIKAARDLWGYVQEDSAADAFLRVVERDDLSWSGHEAFFIVAADTAAERDTLALKAEYWPEVPIRKGSDLSGRKSFFDCSKAEKLLGWVHDNPV